MAFWNKKEESRFDNSSSNQFQSSSEKPPSTDSSSSGDIVEPAVTKGAAESFANKASPEEEIRHRFGGKVRSVLGSGTVIQGKLSFDTPVQIDGKLSGEVFSSKALVIGRSGQVDAEVNVESLIVLGSVKGNIVASERIEVLPGGKLDGEISTPSLIIDDGIFNGTCKMPVSKASHSAEGKESSKIESKKVEQKASDSSESIKSAKSSHYKEDSTSPKTSIPA